MWIIVIILGCIPLFFYWSESVVVMFPQLATYFPHKTENTQQNPGDVTQTDDSFVPARDTKWAQEDSPAGYAAWVISLDGRFRMGVGCRDKQKAAIKLTQLIRTDKGLTTQGLQETQLGLNYRFGLLPLKSGYYQGPELINAVAQFGEVYLQDVEGKQAYAQFTLDAILSGSIAKRMAQRCASSN